MEEFDIDLTQIPNTPSMNPFATFNSSEELTRKLASDIEQCKYALGINLFIGAGNQDTTPANSNQPSYASVPPGFMYPNNVPVEPGNAIWLAIARREIGVREIKNGSNSRIEEYLAAGGAPNPNDDIAWCGGFVAWVMRQAGYKPVSGPLGARNWLNFGRPVQPVIGGIAIFSRGAGGHVGFIVGIGSNHLDILGGNQSNQVKVSKYSLRTLLGVRWP